MVTGGDASHDAVRALVVRRLRARREELVGEIFARVSGDAFGSAGAGDAEYVAGLRATVAATVEYALQGIERGEEWAGPTPALASEQARRAARAGVSLDTVLRRYVLGGALLGECIMEEAHRDLNDWVPTPPIQRDALREALRAQAAALDRLIADVSHAYGEELERAGYGSPAGDGVPALPALLGNPNARRARECLCFIGEQDPRGSGPSNREIATGIGVAHWSQISRLLSQLAAEGLVSKRSQGAGKRNAWRLEPRGEQVLRMLPKRRV
jgi:hypothetical protein